MTGTLWHARWGASRRSVVAWATFLSLLIGTTFVRGQVPIPFTEEAIARGVFAVPLTGFFGTGVGLEDLEGDGDLDLVVTNADLGTTKFFRNYGGGYFAEVPVPAVGTMPYRGVSFCDYDADGDRDLYLTNFTGENALLRNDGNWSFTDVTVASGTSDTDDSTSSSWGDYNNDGWPDLFVCDHGNSTATGPFDNPNKLFRNQGDGTFIDVAPSLGLDDPRPTFQAIFFDPDLDGDQDLYISNDRGYGDPYNHNELWRNDGGIYTPLDSSGAEIAVNSMGADFGDFDANGTLDLFVTNTPPGSHELLLDAGNFTYSSGNSLAGLPAFGAGWGTIFFDYNHDGREDLLAVNSNAPNRFLDCAGGYPCAEIAPQLGLDDTAWSANPSSSYGTAAGDIDGDGDIDLVIASLSEPVAIYMNQSGNLGQWLQIDLIGAYPNLDAVGAVIFLEAGGVVQQRQIKAGSSYLSSSALRVHFGLGSSTTVDQLTIRWPDDTLTELAGVSSNQILTIDQSTAPLMIDCNFDLIPDELQIVGDISLDLNHDGILDSCQTFFNRGDANADGTMNIADVIRTLSFLFSAQPVSCQLALDSNDDDAVNIADAIWSLAFLFTTGPPPVAPFPACGIDPTPRNFLHCVGSLCP